MHGYLMRFQFNPWYIHVDHRVNRNTQRIYDFFILPARINCNLFFGYGVAVGNDSDGFPVRQDDLHAKNTNGSSRSHQHRTAKASRSISGCFCVFFGGYAEDTFEFSGKMARFRVATHQRNFAHGKLAAFQKPSGVFKF